MAVCLMKPMAIKNGVVIQTGVIKSGAICRAFEVIGVAKIEIVK